jgi:hypothetical protein
MFVPPGVEGIYKIQNKGINKKIIQISRKRIMNPEGFFLPQKLLM